MKNKVTLFDKVTGKALILASEDTINENLVLILPNKQGTLALVEDVAEIQAFLQNGQLTASDSSKLGGKDASHYVLTDMSNIDLNSLSTETLNGLKGYTGSIGYTGSAGINGEIGQQGYTGSAGINGTQGETGYTGSKGDTGDGLKITAIFNSTAELMAGTTIEETFGLVAGTLSQTDPEYGTLYLRKNNTWTYITDLSVEGAAGIQGPIGYTGSKGTGYTGSQGIIGYTGSKGDTGSQGIQGPIGYTGSSGVLLTTADIGSHVLASTTYSSGESYGIVNCSYGATIAGSNLKPSSAIGSFSTNTTPTSSYSGEATALTGTWKALSQHSMNSGGSYSKPIGLFVRIA